MIVLRIRRADHKMNVAVGEHYAQPLLDGIIREVIIGIEECNEAAFCEAETFVAGSGHTLVFLPVVGDPAVLETSHHVFRIVGGAVIDDDDLEARVALSHA